MKRKIVAAISGLLLLFSITVNKPIQSNCHDAVAILINGLAKGKKAEEIGEDIAGLFGVTGAASFSFDMAEFGGVFTAAAAGASKATLMTMMGSMLGGAGIVFGGVALIG